MADKKEIRSLSPQDFEYMQQDQKIYDKRFETKPIGYFKDAMIRFRKNRTNVVATVILFAILLGTIIIPVVSTKNFTKLEAELQFLPPRVPLLEKIGIMDGKVDKEGIISDISTPVLEIYDGTLAEAQADCAAEQVDDPNKDCTTYPVEMTVIEIPSNLTVWADLSIYEDTDTVVLVETGLIMPVGYSQEIIELDTLINREEQCSDPDPLCIGGNNVLNVDPNATKAIVKSIDYMQVNTWDDPQFVINIAEFNNGSGDAVLNVYVKRNFTDFGLLTSITEAGEYSIDIYDVFSDHNDVIVSQVKLEFVAPTNTDNVHIESIKVHITGTEGQETVFDNSGYDLSEYTYESGEGVAGRWVRSKGSMWVSDFVYLKYDDALGNKQYTLPTSEYNKILEENPDVCVKIPNPDDANAWYFSKECPIQEVLFKHDDVVVPVEDPPGSGNFVNQTFSSYETIINYGLYAGYEETPYFIFGTDIEGRDLFTLLWVGTRTSLLIGFVVAAINITFGIVYGAISGYYGGTVDLIMQRIAEVIGRIPWIVSLSIFVSLYGTGVTTLIFILIVSGWIGPAAITRTQFYRYKGREYVLASRTLGAKDGRLIFRHILPNGIGTIITASILTIPYVIFAESTISYLGFGIGHGQNFNILGVKFSGVSVGVLLSDGRLYLNEQPHLTIFPALLISILMITFNMFGNALRDAFNPALRGSE